MVARAYPGSEFVVDMEKLEPNEINFSQGFSQKVSTNCFIFNSLPAMSWTQIRPDKMLGQIWIQTFWHPDGIGKIQHPKSKIWHNNKVWRNKRAIFENPKADQNTLFRKYVIFEPPRLYF